MILHHDARPMAYNDDLLSATRARGPVKRLSCRPMTVSSILVWLLAASSAAAAETGTWAFHVEDGDPAIAVAQATYRVGRPCCGAPVVVTNAAGESILTLSIPDSTPEGFGFFTARLDGFVAGVHEYRRTAWAPPAGSTNAIFTYRPTASLTRTLPANPACATGTDRLTLHELRVGSTPDLFGRLPVDALSFDIESRCDGSPLAMFSQYRFNASAVDPRVGLLTLTAPSPVIAGDTIELREDAVPGATPLEYTFWRYRMSTGTWTHVQDYSLNPTFRWTPTASDIDTYYFQVWTRARGSAEDYDDYRVLGPVVVSAAPASVASLTANVTFPAKTGQTITWTAQARGGSAGPLEYQFWRFSPATDWQIVQPYGPSNTFSWTPSWGQEGTQALQVWVRSAGSAAAYEGWMSTGLFQVEHAALHLTSDVLFPLAPGTPVTFEVAVDDPFASLEYQFWLLTPSGWFLAQPYSPSATWSWLPFATGTYAVQVWARQPGSSASYEAWRGTEFLEISESAAKLHQLTSDMPASPQVGTTITWTALASGGASRLEYQFWRFDPSTGWTIAQPWSFANTYAWTTASGDDGRHAVQVWVRSSGSSAPYEAYLSSGLFTIWP